MRRDDKCCMLTGKRDRSGGGVIFAEAAHIIPQATNRNIREEGNKVGICDVRSSVGQRGKLVQQFHSAGVWAVLSMFTDVSLPELLAGDLIHRLENIMIMHHSCHRAFDELVLWLKPVEVRTSDLFPFGTFPMSVHRVYRTRIVYTNLSKDGRRKSAYPISSLSPQKLTSLSLARLFLRFMRFAARWPGCLEQQSTSWILREGWMRPSSWQMMARPLMC
jgi:HNH endonuclease